MYKTLQETEGKKNEDQVYLIKKVLNRIKNTIEKVPEDKKSTIKENEKIWSIVENIFYFNQLEQEREGIKMPNTKPNV